MMTTLKPLTDNNYLKAGDKAVVIHSKNGGVPITVKHIDSDMIIGELTYDKEEQKEYIETLMDFYNMDNYQVEFVAYSPRDLLGVIKVQKLA